MRQLDSSKAENQSLSFILGDHVDLTYQECEFLIENLGATGVSLGPQSYLASHCIIYVLMELKKRNFLPSWEKELKKIKNKERNILSDFIKNICQ